MNDFHKIKAESDRNSVLIIYASELAHVQNNYRQTVYYQGKNKFTCTFLCILQKAVDMTHGAEIRTLPFSLDGSSAIINQR